MARIGGVVMRVQGTLFFLPAASVEEVAPLPQITRLPGGPEELLGIALHRDGLMPVIAVGAARDGVIVCILGGERIALVGAAIVATGVFDGVADDTVLFAGERATPFDLPGQYARVQAGRWGGRWGA